MNFVKKWPKRGHTTVHREADRILALSDTFTNPLHYEVYDFLVSKYAKYATVLDTSSATGVS